MHLIFKKPKKIRKSLNKVLGSHYTYTYCIELSMKIQSKPFSLLEGGLSACTRMPFVCWVSNFKYIRLVGCGGLF